MNYLSTLLIRYICSIYSYFGSFSYLFHIDLVYLQYLLIFFVGTSSYLVWYFYTRCLPMYYLVFTDKSIIEYILAFNFYYFGMFAVFMYLGLCIFADFIARPGLVFILQVFSNYRVFKFYWHAFTIYLTRI